MKHDPTIPLRGQDRYTQADLEILKKALLLSLVMETVASYRCGDIGINLAYGRIVSSVQALESLPIFGHVPEME